MISRMKFALFFAPQQALTMLNHRFTLDMANALAARPQAAVHPSALRKSSARLLILSGRSEGSRSRPRLWRNAMRAVSF